MDYQSLPNFNAPTLQGQVEQIKNFLHQFIQNYNFQISNQQRLIDEIKGDKK